MKSTCIDRAVPLLLFAVSITLIAQVAPNHDTAPLKNWPTPLYWHPTPQEARANTSLPVPELQFPSGLSSDALTYVAMTPCRVVDTRTDQRFPSPFGQPSLTAGASRTFPISTSTTCSIPAIAQAYSFNVTVVPQGPLGFLTVAPTPISGTPTTATLNSLQGFIVGNAAIVPAGTNGSVDVYATNTTDVIIDINGYFSPPTTTTTDANTCVGLACLANLTTGNFNAAIGDHPGYHDTSGNSNTYLGDHAGYSDTSGSFNTFTGANAGYNNTADDNSFFGYKAGFMNTTGFQNTFLGYQVGMNNTTAGNTTFGESNTFVGYDSGMSSKTSQGNTFVGTNTGTLSGGVNPNDCCNTYVGNGSGQVAATSNNTFVGYRTG
jgi:hypothetical protein